jgi:hypothetical protein
LLPRGAERLGARIVDVIRLGLGCLVVLLVAAACTSAAPTASQQPPIFEVDSATATCANEMVGIELAIQHAIARPGYLDCITVTLEADPDGTIWLCNPVREPAASGCEGPRMELHGVDPLDVAAIWHVVGERRWSDPVQLLGRVRFR